MTILSLAGMIGLVAFGDSYVVGAPYANFATPGYIYQFAAQHGLAVRNYAFGGSPLFAHVQAAHAQLAPNRTNELAILGGSFHDARRGGNNARTYIKVEHLYRSWLANAFLGVAYPASAGTNVGMVRAWPDAGLQSMGIKSYHLGGYALAGGLGCSVTKQVTGSKVVVGYMIADGIAQNFGPFRVTIDGVLRATIDPNGKSDALGYYPGGYDQARVPAAAIFDVGPGTHTVLIEPQGSQSLGPWTVIDYIGALVEPENAAPAIMLTPPRMTAAGYALQAPEWSNATDSLIQFQGFVMRAVAAEFDGYPVAVVETNDFFNLSTDVYEDHAHPNLSGHGHLKDALNSAISG